MFVRATTASTLLFLVLPALAAVAPVVPNHESSSVSTHTSTHESSSVSTHTSTHISTHTPTPTPTPTPSPSPSPSPSPAPAPGGQCNTGEIQCCNSTQQNAGGIVGILAGLLGIVLGPIEGLIGVGCSPTTIIGTSGTSCSAQPVCCTGNNFSGLLVLGCSPLNLNL